MKRATLLLAFLFTVVSSWAAAPLAPGDFEAKVFQSPDGQVVKLMWVSHREGDAATSFDIYQASGETEELADFAKIGSVEVKPDVKQYMYQIPGLALGQYTFFVRAVNADGESERTRIRVVTLKEFEATIDILSEPVKRGTVDRKYLYQVKAGKNFEGRFTFALEGGPDGMKIDAATGVIMWERPVKGEYALTVIVTAEYNGTTITKKQEFVLVIGEGDKPKEEYCAFIAGSVTGGNDGVGEGTVIAYRLETVRHEKKDTVIEERGYRAAFKGRIEQGKYSINLPAGTYRLRIEGAHFLPEWHDNVTELAEATDVVVTCDVPRQEIDFAVTMRPEEKFIVHKARVTDETSGEGIKALVIFDAQSEDGKDFNPKVGRVIGETNAEGYYEVRLREGVNYIAHAESAGRNANAYVPEYWEETADVTAATIITPAADMKAINFTLAARPAYENGISGQIVDDSSGAGLRGKVTAYALDAKGAKRWTAVTVETNDEGNFTITNLLPGNYILFAVTGERPHVPGWYVDNGIAAHEWKDATAITVEETGTVEGAVIRLIKAKNMIGKGKMRGWVYDRRGGIIVKNEGTPVQGLVGVPGALIIVTDASGNVVDYAMSANEGAYTLNNLSLSTHTVSIDRVGFEGVAETVSLDEENFEVTPNFGLVSLVSSVEVPVDAVGTTLQLYPNPAQSSATISFASVAGTASIRILSTTGAVLGTQDITVNAGRTTATLNVADLPSGMVLVHVTNGTTTFALPLSIVR